jgi:hypothetical protein
MEGEVNGSAHQKLISYYDKLEQRVSELQQMNVRLKERRREVKEEEEYFDSDEDSIRGNNGGNDSGDGRDSRDSLQVEEHVPFSSPSSASKGGERNVKQQLQEWRSKEIETRPDPTLFYATLADSIKDVLKMKKRQRKLSKKSDGNGGSAGAGGPGRKDSSKSDGSDEDSGNSDSDSDSDEDKDKEKGQTRMGYRGKTNSMHALSPVTTDLFVLGGELLANTEHNKRRSQVELKDSEKMLFDAFQSLSNGNRKGKNSGTNELIRQAKSTYGKVKDRIDFLQRETKTYTKAYERFETEAAYLNKELIQRLAQIRLADLREQRRPRAAPGEPTSLLMNDDLWRNTLPQYLTAYQGGLTKDTSSIKRSLLGLTASALLTAITECTYSVQNEWVESLVETVGQVDILITGLSRMLSQLSEMGNELHEDDVVINVQHTSKLIGGAEKAVLYLVETSSDSTNLILWTHADGSSKESDNSTSASEQGGGAGGKSGGGGGKSLLKKEWIIVPMRRFKHNFVGGENEDDDEDEDGFSSPLPKTVNPRQLSKEDRRTSFYTRLGVKNVEKTKTKVCQEQSLPPPLHYTAVLKVPLYFSLSLFIYTTATVGKKSSTRYNKHENKESG